MNPDDKVFPQGMGRLIGVIVGLLLLASLGALARYTNSLDFAESESVRKQGADACAALSRPSADLSAVTAAVEAFEDDKQLVLSIAARQAESRLQGGTDTESIVADLATDCRAVYEDGS